MLRNIHFFNVKPGVDEKRILHLIDSKIAEYAKTFGCIERKTWKLLDARSPGPFDQPAQSATYMNESLWPSQKEADAFGRADPPDEIREVFQEVFSGIQFQKSVRYVDEKG